MDKSNAHNELVKLVHPNTLNFYKLPSEAALRYASPVELLTSRRLDVLARVLYAKELLLNYKAGWGCVVYEQLMKCWTNDFTPPREVEPGRFTMADYHQQFTQLVLRMSEQGFSASTSIIPTCQGTLVDGAHRLAAAIALGLDQVATVELVGEPQEQNYQTLLSIGMSREAVESMVFELVRIKKGARVALLFPCAANMHAAGLERLEQTFLVDYHVDIQVTFSGLKRLMSLCYGAHDWWAEVHAYRFAKRRFKGTRPLRVVFFQEDGQDVRSFKDAVRDFIGNGNDSLHTTDSHEETLQLAEVLLNDNGKRWLNVVRELDTPRFDLLFDAFREQILSEQADSQVCIDSGGVLAAHGLRDVTDLDYLEFGATGSFDRGGEINCHNGEYKNTGISETAIINDPRLHFYYRGLRFASLPVVRALKIARGSEKDLDDVALIDGLNEGWCFHAYLQLRSLYKSAKEWKHMLLTRAFANLVRVAKFIWPKKYHPAARKLFFWFRGKK